MTGTVYLAHISQDKRKQTVAEHCRGTAQYASDSLKAVGMSDTAYLASLMHDMGKCKEAYSSYLKSAVDGDANAKRGSVNHSFAGARFALDRWHDSEELGYEEITAELIAFAIGSHHGLFDCVDERQNSGFYHRQTKEGIGYKESVENYLQQCAPKEELDARFAASVHEMTPIIGKISTLSQQEDVELANGETFFYIGLLARMLLSAVIEGDRRDTAAFMSGDSLPRYPENMRQIWSDCLARVEAKLNSFSMDKDINRVRRAISDTCASFADRPGGVFRLNVPTGGGKTLSSLRYALTHAKRWNKSRIIFTSPLLSILDQNADIIRDYIGDNSLILEHHSNFAEPENTLEQLQNFELLMDSWEAPVIITTLVQLMNTCFSGKTSSVRRFHSLTNSIIVIDEVQTVPTKMLTLFNLTVNFLSEICGATVVLCSATQPGLESVQHPLLRKPDDIVLPVPGLWDVFKRTEIRDAGCLRLAALPQIIENSLQECNSLLVVCNKKDEAAFLFREMRNKGYRCFHLSAAMCTAHRRTTLQALETALEEAKTGGKKLVCISTQVIEAGVDISFQQVIRLTAGMDSVIQSAGRCNRHAEQAEPAPVSIVQCMDEKLFHLQDIVWGKNATIALLDAFRKNPERFQGDLSSKKAIAFYYTLLYNNMEADYQDDVTKEYGSIYHLLSDNPKYADANCENANRYFLRQAFGLAGKLFQVFDQNTTDVLVPYEKGRDIREQLINATQIHGAKDWKEIKGLIEEAKGYSVSLYQYQLDKLLQLGAVMPLFEESVFVLADGFYDEDTGFSIQKGINDYWEV